MEVCKQHYSEMRLGAASISQSVCRSEKQCNLDSLTKIQLCDGYSKRANKKMALPPSFVLKVFQKYLQRKTEFYWIFGYVMRQNIAKYIEG